MVLCSLFMKKLHLFLMQYINITTQGVKYFSYKILTTAFKNVIVITI